MNEWMEGGKDGGRVEDESRETGGVFQTTKKSSIRTPQLL